VIVFVGRVSAMLAGIAIVGLSFFGAVWVLFAASFVVERPVLDDILLVLTMASTDALIFAGGVALLGYASERRWPRWSSLRWLPILAAAGLAALMGATLLPPT
jgi:hypothetical protein